MAMYRTITSHSLHWCQTSSMDIHFCLILVTPMNILEFRYVDPSWNDGDSRWVGLNAVVSLRFNHFHIWAPSAWIWPEVHFNHSADCCRGWKPPLQQPAAWRHLSSSADCFSEPPQNISFSCFRFLVLYTMYSSGLAVLYLSHSK